MDALTVVFRTRSQIEADVVEATRTWSDGLRAALIAVQGEEQGHALLRVYADAFPPGYQERFIAEEAVADIDKIEQSLVSQDLSLTLYRPFGTAENRMRFKIFQLDRSIILSTVVPMLEDLGLRVVDEVPHVVRLGPGGDGRIVMIHDFGVETRSGNGIDIGAVRERFKEAFLAVWKGGVESDRFNSLVIEGGLTCREVVVIRAYSKYLRQAGIAISEAYMQETMTRHPGLACAIIGLFTTLFDPTRTEAATAAREGDNWRVSGSKRPCSLSRSMDLLTASVAVPDEDGGSRLGVALIPAESPGIRVEPFWSSWVLAGAESDAVILEDVEVHPDLVVYPEIGLDGQLDRRIDRGAWSASTRRADVRGALYARVA